MSLRIILEHPEKQAQVVIKYTYDTETVFIPREFLNTSNDMNIMEPYTFPKDLKGLQQQSVFTEDGKKFTLPGFDEADNIEAFLMTYNEARRKKGKPEMSRDKLMSMIDMRSMGFLSRMKYTVYLTYLATGALPKELRMDIAWFGLPSANPEEAAVTMQMLEPIFAAFGKLQKIKSILPF